MLLEKPILFWFKSLLFMSFVKLAKLVFQLLQTPKLATVWKEKRQERGEEAIHGGSVAG